MTISVRLRLFIGSMAAAAPIDPMKSLFRTLSVIATAGRSLYAPSASL